MLASHKPMTGKPLWHFAGDPHAEGYWIESHQQPKLLGQQLQIEHYSPQHSHRHQLYKLWKIIPGRHFVYHVSCCQNQVLFNLNNLLFATISSMVWLKRLVGNLSAFLNLFSFAIVGANGTDMLTTDCPCFFASSASS